MLFVYTLMVAMATASIDCKIIVATFRQMSSLLAYAILVTVNACRSRSRRRHRHLIQTLLHHKCQSHQRQWRPHRLILNDDDPSTYCRRSMDHPPPARQRLHQQSARGVRNRNSDAAAEHDEQQLQRIAGVLAASASSGGGGGGNNAKTARDAKNVCAPDSGLEYHIKFPSSNFNYNKGDVLEVAGDDEHCSDLAPLIAVDEERLPVVLLFGWAGCQDKYLAKYSKIYEDKGLITLRYIVPMKYLLWKRYQVVYIGRKLVKLLYDLNFEKHPIVVHCFSNGGAFLYQNFALALDRCKCQDSIADGAAKITPIQVKGVIFDSGPGKRRLQSLYRAISAIMGGNIVYNTAMSLFFTLFCSMIWIYEIIQKYLFGAEKYLVADPFDKLKNEAHMWPQHFIYSEADDIISHKDVEHFIAFRKSLGVAVSALKFADSPHVKHYSVHPESYLWSVYTFLGGCLSREKDDTVTRKRDKDACVAAAADDAKGYGGCGAGFGGGEFLDENIPMTAYMSAADRYSI